SARKVEQAIDAIVDAVDPAALRRSRKATCDRDVQFGSPSDEAGFTSMWARMYAPDAVVLKQRVEEMARGVCADDPRTLGERRSDALAAIAAGITELACDCASSECAAAGRDAAPPVGAVIHVVAHADTVEAATAAPARDVPPPPEPSPPAVPDVDAAPPPAAEHVAAAPAPVEPDVEPASTARRGQVPPALCPAPAAERAATSPASCSAPPAFVIGAGVMPAPLLAATLERATVREIRHPGDAPPEPRYTPSRALADFVRCRDLTCRWPGCDKPAYGCDIDHTVPWPVGPTHASNLKCYCRFHHLLKTFYCGAGGWRERQLPDGTLILTAPTGHTYTTKPGSLLLFPTLCQPTGELHLPAYQPTRGSDGRGAMMPKRRRTRAENLARRIQAERKLNDDYVAERNKPPPF
ncbi:HNH endonuclease signature motif containing protein, partial [Mycolicibacterium moriokaense]